MNKNLNIVSLISYLFAISLFNQTAFASTENAEFNIKEIAEGNFLHTGQHVAIDDEQHDDIANIGFIIGESCVAVIDTGGSIKVGSKLLKSIRAKTDKPICYVINTHVHFDHILGNQVFASDKTQFVGHYKLADDVEQNKPFFLENFKNDLGENPTEKSIIGPNILIDKSTNLDLGNRKLTLIPYSASHSHTDLIIIDDKTGTLWAGDLIFRQRIPSLTGSLKGWIKVMTELTKLDVKQVVPGHGSIANSVTEALENQQQYLTRLLDDTRKAIAEGQFISDAMETIDKENKSNWLLHEQQHASNVSKAFTELEWE